MIYSSLNLSLLLPEKPVPIKPVGLPVSVRVGHFKARPGPEARPLEDALPVQGSWRVGLGSGSGFGSGLTSLEMRSLNLKDMLIQAAIKNNKIFILQLF